MGTSYYTNEQNLNSKTAKGSNFPNPSPFPDSNLLEQLSSKLALEESYAQSSYHISHGSKKCHNSYQEVDADHDLKGITKPSTSKKSQKKTLDTSKVKKSQKEDSMILDHIENKAGNLKLHSAAPISKKAMSADDSDLQ